MNRVVNCTVISNFAAVHRLDVLRNTSAPLYLPSDVYQEVVAGQLAGYTFYDDIEKHITPITPDGWMVLTTLTNEELRLTTSLPHNLHPGEQACLCIARERGWGVLTDDWAARQQARRWNIPLSGTIGVLLLAVEDGFIPLKEGNRLLNDMVRLANYRSPVVDLTPLLAR